MSNSLWPHGLQYAKLLSFTISQSLLKFMSMELVMPSKHPILCHSLLVLPSIFPSIRVFSNELALCNRWPKYWSFSFSNSLSNECSGLISFRIDWFGLFAVQGTHAPGFEHRRLYLTIESRFIWLQILGFWHVKMLISNNCWSTSPQPNFYRGGRESILREDPDFMIPYLRYCRKLGLRGWSCSRSQASPWGRVPNVGPWLHAQNNSRMSWSKVRADLKQIYSGRNTFHRQCGSS